MDAALVDSTYIGKKIDVLKCQSTAFSENWYKEEFFGITRCRREVPFHEEDYTLLIDLLSYYQYKDFNPSIISDCPTCTTVVKNCPTLPKIIELI